MLKWQWIFVMWVRASSALKLVHNLIESKTRNQHFRYCSLTNDIYLCCQWMKHNQAISRKFYLDNGKKNDKKHEGKESQNRWRTTTIFLRFFHNKIFRFSNKSKSCSFTWKNRRPILPIFCARHPGRIELWGIHACTYVN